jgi:protein tyrosine phosphatase (PTP) superfamily phosphohydrolase (DUF442 family)
MANLARWLLGTALLLMLTVAPFVYYRSQYTDGKRLRIVEPDVLYRCGQLSVDGFTHAVLRYKIRTIINVQEDFPDPDLIENWFSPRPIKESELCRQLGVRYIHLPPDLISRRRLPPDRPEAIDRFLEIMDDPANHPVLIHCRAGLHRTGAFCAIYRMEYQGWTDTDAVEEMKDHGFGIFCNAANDNVKQYVLTYRPGLRKAN